MGKSERGTSYAQRIDFQVSEGASMPSEDHIGSNAGLSAKILVWKLPKVHILRCRQECCRSNRPRMTTAVCSVLQQGSHQDFAETTRGPDELGEPGRSSHPVGLRISSRYLIYLLRSRIIAPCIFSLSPLFRVGDPGWVPDGDIPRTPLHGSELGDLIRESETLGQKQYMPHKASSVRWTM